MAYQSFVDRATAPLPRLNIPAPEGMGDFFADVGARPSVGPQIGKLRQAGRAVKALGTRGVARTLLGPEAAAIGALGSLAGATANQAVQSGQYTEPGVTKALPGTFPGRAVDVRGISNTNPFTGQVVTNYKNAIPLVPTAPPTANKVVAPWVAHPEDWSQVSPATTSNSVTPLATPAKINEPIMLPSLPSQAMSAPVLTQGGTDLNAILKTIQSVQPIQDYASRINALNTGNTTWDMDSLGKILAAKAGQKADTERYAQQVGALANLGSAQMQAEAAREGHRAVLAGQEAQREIEREKNAYMAPYYSALGKEAGAKAEAAPLAAKADVLKALTEQAKENPVLKASLETLKGFADRGDAQGYNDYAMKISLLTGKLIPKMLVQD